MTSLKSSSSTFSINIGAIFAITLDSPLASKGIKIAALSCNVVVLIPNSSIALTQTFLSPGRIALSNAKKINSIASCFESQPCLTPSINTEKNGPVAGTLTAIPILICSENLRFICSCVGNSCVDTALE